MSGIMLNDDLDIIIWTCDKQAGIFKASIVYEYILQYQSNVVPVWWYSRLWKAKVPQKVKCFIWLVIKHKVLSWDLLQCKGFQGPRRCIMCKHDGETTERLFCHFPLFRSLWIYICLGLGVTWSWNHKKCVDLIKAVDDHLVLSMDIICSFMWDFWLSRNRMIF